MPSPLRKITKKTIIVINVITIFFYLLSCLAPHVDPNDYWYISIFGLGFHLLFMCLTGFVFFWLITKPKMVLLPLFALIFGYKSIAVVWGFHSLSAVRSEKNKSDIRIASWNVARFLEWKRNGSEKSRTRLKILEQIKKQNADILCLQEFFYSPDTVFYNNIREIKAMGYPNFYFSYDPDGDKQYIGVIIFSKYPMIDTGLVRYFRPSMPEALIHADIKIGNDTIRVFTTHLQSVQFRKKEYDAIKEIKSAEDSLFINSKTILSKLRKAMKYRSTQADVVRKILNDSPFPYILCSDMNDTPNSHTYFTIRGNMQDAFLEKGFGIGRTFNSISPTLRIDYIFADDHFKIQQFDRVVKNLSDHFMILADLKLQ